MGAWPLLLRWLTVWVNAPRTRECHSAPSERLTVTTCHKEAPCCRADNVLLLSVGSLFKEHAERAEIPCVDDVMFDHCSKQCMRTSRLQPSLPPDTSLSRLHMRMSQRHRRRYLLATQWSTDLWSVICYVLSITLSHEKEPFRVMIIFSSTKSLQLRNKTVLLMVTSPRQWN